MQTPSGYFAFEVAFFILFALIVIYLLRRYRHKGVVLMLPLLLLTQLPIGSASTDTTIHVLGVADEEFNAMYPEGWERYLGWEIYIYSAFDKLQQYTGKTFMLCGWEYFQSPPVGDYSILRTEIVTQLSFQSMVSQYNGYTIDVILALTCNRNLDYIGYAFIGTSVCVLYWYPEAPRDSLIMHELSHLFSLWHCSSDNECVMALEDGAHMFQYQPTRYCNTCLQALQTTCVLNRYDRVYESSGGGGCGSGHKKK